jgi:hypothetical protein
VKITKDGMELELSVRYDTPQADSRHAVDVANRPILACAVIGDKHFYARGPNERRALRKLTDDAFVFMRRRGLQKVETSVVLCFC